MSYFYYMQQIYARDGPQTLTCFSSVNYSKKWTAIPNFMLTANFQHQHKTLPMFQLERSWLNSNSLFRDLVADIANFNKYLLEIPNPIHIPNYLQTYHLHKNLHEQLQNLNSLVSTLKDAKQQLEQINKKYLKEKTKLKEVKHPKILPVINSSAMDPEEEENLRKTVRQIQTKRQYEVHTLMPKTYYAQYLPFKDRTFVYKNEQEQLEMSQTVQVLSEVPYESRLLEKQASVESFGQKSKSVSNLASTTWTSQAQSYSNFLNKHNKLNGLRVKQSPEVKPFSEVFSSGKKQPFNRSHSKSVSTLEFTPKIKTKLNKHSEKLLDNMLTKDKIEKILCRSDSRIIKNLSIKEVEKDTQTGNLKSSQLSFIVKPQKTQLVNRREFLSVKFQLNKFKKTQNRLRKDLNRKLEFSKYLSNHMLQLNTQVHNDHKRSLTSEIGKKIMALPKKDIDFTQPQQHLSESQNPNRLNIIPEESLHDAVEVRKKQFEDGLRKESVKSSISSYMKYINNHLADACPEDEAHSQLGKTISSNFSSHFGTTRKSFISQSEKKFQSLTSFRTMSLQKNIGPQKSLAVIKALNSHSIKHSNQEALDEVVRLKLKIASVQKGEKLNAVIRNKLLLKGLELHHAPEDAEYEVIQPKLFSNPFFVAPKASKKGKKKKK